MPCLRGDPSFLISILHAFPAQVRPVQSMEATTSAAPGGGSGGGGDDPGKEERGRKRALAEF